MRNSGTRGYTGYRGRRGNGRKWLIAALVVILLAAVGFLLAQRYVVYGSDGSFRFAPPWADRLPRHEAEETPPPETPPQELEIIIERREEPETPPAPVSEAVRAQALADDALRGSAAGALEALAATEANAAAIRVKNSRGELLYDSALPEAIEADAVAGDADAGAVLDALLASDYRTIARISALHDSIYSFAHMPDAAIQQIRYPGYIWYAPDSSFYLAPEKELTRQYLCAVAAECAERGFDELLFDDFSYPTQGRLNNIKTDERTMTKAEALSLLAAELRAAVPDATVLSVVVSEAAVLSGADADGGQDVNELSKSFSRFYVPTSEERLPELYAALADCEVELIPILTAPLGDGPYLIEAP